MFKLDPQNPKWSDQFLDPYFSCVSPLVDETCFGLKKKVFEKSESPLILFYIKRENKTIKKTPKSDSVVLENHIFEKSESRFRDQVTY